MLVWCKSTGDDGEFDPEQTTVKRFKQDDITLIARGFINRGIGCQLLRVPEHGWFARLYWACNHNMCILIYGREFTLNVLKTTLYKGLHLQYPELD